VAALRAVAGQPEVSAALAAAAGSDLTPVRPGWIDDGTAVRLVLPGEPGWPGQGGDE
jgi:hypothetical protein